MERLLHLLQRDPQRPQHPYVLPEHGQPHGGAVPPLQGQEHPAAEQTVPEGHRFVLSHEGRVQVVEGGLTRRRHVQVQRVQLGRSGEQPEQTPGQFLDRPLQEQVTGTQEDTGQAGELRSRGDHLRGKVKEQK